MKNIITSLVVFTILVSSSSLTFSQETNNVGQLVDGLSFADGVFYPTHSIVGLTYTNGSWVDPTSLVTPNPYQADADAAASLLAGGGTWATLSSAQKEAYANVYPTNAVALAGAGALNLMNPSILTPSIVYGYGNVGGTWTNPITPVSGGVSYIAPSMYGAQSSGTNDSYFRQFRNLTSPSYGTNGYTVFNVTTGSNSATGIGATWPPFLAQPSSPSSVRYK